MKKFIEYIEFKSKAEQKKKQISKVANLLTNLFYIPYITNESRKIKAHEITEPFWLDSSSQLHKWLKSHGIVYTGEGLPNYIQGGSGRAYFIEDNVIKMSTNRVEANVADIVKGREDIPTPVIDVIYLEKGIYAILQHYIKTKGKRLERIKQAADYLTMIVDEYPSMEGYPEKREDQIAICNEILERHGGDRSLLSEMLLILDVLIRLYKATGFKHDDAGPTNIGLHRGKIVIPDLGPNETEDYNELEALAKIRRNQQALGLPKRTNI